LGGCTEDYANPEGIYKEIQRSLKRFEKEDGNGLEDSKYNCLTSDCYSRFRPSVQRL
jgi:hypothetical protein